MAVGTTLEQLLVDLKARVGHTTRVSAGVDFNQSLKNRLKSAQNQLYERYMWPRLTVVGTKLTSAGQRFYDIPTGTNIDRIEKLAFYWQGEPIFPDRGIGFEHYAERDSDLDERADPVLAWDLRWTGAAAQIELWPIPVTNNQPFRTIGMRPLRPLVADDDVADLDDELIVLYASAAILARQGSKDAELELRTAEKYLADLRKNSQSASKPIVYGGETSYQSKRRGTTIHVTSSS